MSDSNNVVPLLCDHCGQAIEQLGHAWVEWVTNPEAKIVRVRVVHHRPASPLGGCYLTDTPAGQRTSEGFVWDLPAKSEEFAGSLREAQRVRAHLRESYGFAGGIEGLDSVRALEKAARAWAG